METNGEVATLLATVMGVAAATSEIVQALIETHPYPQQLQIAWLRRTVNMVEGEMDTGPFDVIAYRDALLENMRGISQVIEQACRTDEDSN